MNLNHSFHTNKIIAGFLAAFAVVLTTEGCKETTNSTVDDNFTDPSVMPAVVSTVPMSGSTGPFSLYDKGEGFAKPHFVLTFNKLMYIRSFALSTIRLEGFDRPVVARVEGGYYYEKSAWKKTSSPNSVYYDHILAFFIVDSTDLYSPISYTVGQQCTITLDSTVEDINGNHPSGPYSFTFFPEPYFRSVGMFPKDGSKDFSIAYRPNFYFNSPVNASIFGSLRFSPTTPGDWKIVNSDSTAVSFEQLQPLQFSTSYVMTVVSSATDAQLRPIGRAYSSAFTTIAFRPIDIYPWNGATDVYLNNGISVLLSGVMDSGTVRSGFTISPPVTGTFNLWSPANSFNYYPADGYRQNTTYTISISSLLKASDGTPATPTTSTFRTGPFLIENTYPYNGSTNVSLSNQIEVFTNANLSAATIASAISSSPAITGSVSSVDGYPYFIFVPSTQLLPNTQYTVTISSSLSTKAGDHLLTPYTFSFKTRF